MEDRTGRGDIFFARLKRFFKVPVRKLVSVALLVSSCHSERMIENNRKNMISPDKNGVFDFAALLSMEIGFVNVQNGGWLPQCPNGGKTTSWWCLCSRVQHGSGNILLY